MSGRHGHGFDRIRFGLDERCWDVYCYGWDWGRSRSCPSPSHLWKGGLWAIPSRQILQEALSADVLISRSHCILQLNAIARSCRSGWSMKPDTHHCFSASTLVRSPNRVMLDFTLPTDSQARTWHTQPNLQRGAIALVAILRQGMLREGSASSKRQSRIGAVVATLG